MKKQAGFSVVEVSLMLVVVGLLIFGGWFVFSKQRGTDKNTEQPRTTEQTTDGQTATFESKQYGFKFSYPKDWGDVTITKSLVEGKTGTAYDIIFSQPKHLAGFKTNDWVSKDGTEAGVQGFVAYGGCMVGPPVQNVVMLYETADVCVAVSGQEFTDQAPYNGKAAAVFLEKAFSEQSPYAGVSFQYAPVAVDDFSESTLKNAYEQETLDGMLQIAKSLKEL